MSNDKLSLSDVYAARQRISSIARRTSLKVSSRLSEITGAKVLLKLENTQETGAFKIRGASNKILSLTEDEKKRGVITVSSGNHGKAVSYIAGKLGIKAIICMAKTVPEDKCQAIRALGAELILKGKNADEAMEYADQLQAELGLTMVHPFDDLDIIAGQGVIGLELYEDFPEIDTVIVPLSGGGLMSGIAFTIKSIQPTVRVIGVSMELGPAMVDSLKAGKLVEIVEEPSLADALVGGLNKDNKYTLPMVQQYMDEAVLVSEEEIAQGIWFCLNEEHMVVEGGAAVGVAALQAGKINNLGKNIAVVISGANLPKQVLKEIISAH